MTIASIRFNSQQIVILVQVMLGFGNAHATHCPAHSCILSKSLRDNDLQHIFHVTLESRRLPDFVTAKSELDHEPAFSSLSISKVTIAIGLPPQLKWHLGVNCRVSGIKESSLMRIDCTLRNITSNEKGLDGNVCYADSESDWSFSKRDVPSLN